MTVNSRVLSRATVIELLDGQKALVVDVEISCPYCGDYLIRFSGHHLKPIRDLVLDFIAQYPELAGPDSVPEGEVVEYEFPAKEPQDPRNN